MIEDFAHRLTIERIRDGERIDLVADDQERAAIAERLGLSSLERLEAHACLAIKGHTVRATGREHWTRLGDGCDTPGQVVANQASTTMRDDNDLGWSVDDELTQCLR